MHQFNSNNQLGRVKINQIYYNNVQGSDTYFILIPGTQSGAEERREYELHSTFHLTYNAGQNMANTLLEFQVSTVKMKQIRQGGKRFLSFTIR
jgi:hypothetical protein